MRPGSHTFQYLNLSGIVGIGTCPFIHALFEHFFGATPDMRSVIAGEGEEIELKMTTHFFDGL